MYRFRAPHAVSFRCVFDSAQLHACAARYSERLAPGRHTLRVRAVGRGGALGRLVTVRIVVTVPYARLSAGKAVRVGAGAGLPAVAGGSVWVPLTASGELARVDPVTGSVTGKTRVGVPAAGPGFLDSAAAAGGAVWSASDAGGTIARVDASSGARTQTLAVGHRPGGLVAGGGGIWSFAFLRGDVTRIDTASGAKRTLHVNASATGVGYGDDELWVLSTLPPRILEVDPASGAVRASFTLRPPFPEVYSVIDTWSLAVGDGAVWAALPNNGAVARLDVRTHALRYVRTPYGRPFGVSVGDGSAWVATDHGVLRLDGSTGKPTGVALLPAAEGSGFASIAFADGAAWFANYDRGTLTKVAG